MPYTNYRASMNPSVPAFGVSVAQYLTHGSTNGDQDISIPRGGLKFSLNITRWPFLSPSDSLMLNVTLVNIMDGADFTGAHSFSQHLDLTAMASVGLSLVFSSCKCC